MTDEERIVWLDRCAKCTRYKPQKKTLHCELTKAIRARNQVATENLEKFTDEYGICKQYEPVD